MPKLYDPATKKSYEIEWNEERDPTPEEVDGLLEKAVGAAKSAMLPEKPGMMAKAGEKLSELFGSKQVETGVQTPFGPETKREYGSLRPGLTTEEGWSRPQDIVPGAIKDLARTGMEFAENPMGIPVKTGVDWLLEKLSPEAAARSRDNSEQIRGMLKPRTPSEEAGGSIPPLAEFAAGGGAASKAARGGKLLARMATEGVATGLVERLRGGDLKDTAIAAALGGAVPAVGAAGRGAKKAISGRGGRLLSEVEPGSIQTNNPDLITFPDESIPSGVNPIENPAYLKNPENAAEIKQILDDMARRRTPPDPGLNPDGTSQVASTELLDAIKTAKSGALRQQGAPDMLKPFDPSRKHPFSLNDWEPVPGERPLPKFPEGSQRTPGGEVGPSDVYGNESFKRIKYIKPARNKQTGKMIKNTKVEKEFDFPAELTQPTSGTFGEAATKLQKLIGSFDRLSSDAVKPYMPELEDIVPEMGSKLGRYHGKFSPENTGTFEYNPAMLARYAKDSDEFADLLANVYAHEKGGHGLAGAHVRANKAGILRLGEDTVAEVGPLGREASKEGSIYQGLNPQSHKIVSGEQTVMNTPGFLKNRDLLRQRLREDPSIFEEFKKFGEQAYEAPARGGMDFPSGEWNPRRVLENIQKSGGKGAKQEGKKISWTAADGTEKSVEIGVDKIGARTFGENPRAQGLAPRAIGLNPRAGLAERLGGEGIEIPKEGGVSGGDRPFTGETGALRIGPRREIPPTPAQENAPRKATLTEKVADVTNISRTLKSAIDFSMPIRQAGLFTARHPVMALKAAVKMVKTAFSEKEFGKLAEELASRQNAASGRYSNAGLALTSHPQHALAGKIGQIGDREEAFLSTLAENLPVIGPAVRGSNRAAVTFLNQARADMFDHLAIKYSKIGVPDKDIAKYVNIITGRAGLGKVGEKAAGILQSLLFSPRFLASRVQSLTHMIPKTGLLHPQLQKELAKDWLAYGGAVGSVLGAAQLAGAKVEYNPKSSNYLKIVFGKTHIDIGGSYPQLATFFAQMLTGERKVEDGKIVSTGSKDHGKPSGEIKKRMETALRFGRSKLNPPVGLAADVFTGKNYIGEPMDEKNPWHWSREAKDLITPMYPSDLFESVKEHGAAKGALISTPSLIGGNVNIYDPKSGGKKKDPNKFKKEVMELKNSRIGKLLREAK